MTPTGRILDTLQRLREGDLSARTGLEASGEALSQIGVALDALAATLEAHEHELQRALADTMEEARTDALTGLYNARFLSEALERQIAIASRTGKPFSLIVLDIDRFKAVNDTFGHDAGDQLLRDLAGVVRHSIRVSDMAMRHGGEEFAVLLPDTTLDVAAQRAEHIRRSVEAHHTLHAGKSISVTVSLGVAQYDAGTNAEAIMKVADAAMYAAKSAGRNRVVLSPLPAGRAAA